MINLETLDTAKSLSDLVKKEAYWIGKVRVQVDIPEKLRASLEKEANDSDRKLSNYIVHILKQRKNIWNKQ
jgi:hypothetical protein